MMCFGFGDAHTNEFEAAATARIRKMTLQQIKEAFAKGNQLDIGHPTVQEYSERIARYAGIEA